MHPKQAIIFLDAFTKMHTVRHETRQHLEKCFFDTYVGLATKKRHVSIAFQIFFPSFIALWNNVWCVVIIYIGIIET